MPLHTLHETSVNYFPLTKNSERIQLVPAVKAGSGALGRAALGSIR